MTSVLLSDLAARLTRPEVGEVGWLLRALETDPPPEVFAVGAGPLAAELRQYTLSGLLVELLDAVEADGPPSRTRLREVAERAGGPVAVAVAAEIADQIVACDPPVADVLWRLAADLVVAAGLNDLDRRELAEELRAFDPVLPTVPDPTPASGPAWDVDPDTPPG